MPGAAAHVDETDAAGPTSGSPASRTSLSFTRAAGLFGSKTVTYDDTKEQLGQPR